MYRNLYDTDTTTWSPQGRLHQVEYAMEGVKLGTCCVGVRSNSHVVIAGLKRSLSKLAKFNEKLFRVDDHLGLAFSGITADARYLSDVMRRECLNHQFVFSTPHPVGTLVAKIGSKSQLNTQRYSKRPYGCGLIIGGIDCTGPHLYETCPSGNYAEYFAIAIGSRSQSAKTYLEKNFETFKDLSECDLIYHAVRALHCSVPQDQELTTSNMTVAVLSAEKPWRELESSELQQCLDKLPTPPPAEMTDDQPTS